MHAISSVENANIHHSAAKVAKASHIYKHSILFFSFLVTICHGFTVRCAHVDGCALRVAR